MENARVSQVINVGKIDAQGKAEATKLSKVRIIHISDTHMRHDRLNSLLPDGDILIHSGDFSQWDTKRQFGNKTRDREALVEEINRVFSSLPHKHKVLIPGNHEGGFTTKDKEYLESNLSSVIYLQDKIVTIEGLNIYGTPWTRKRWDSLADAFTKSDKELEPIWDMIPEETDILVTHTPPSGICDLATKKFAGIKNLFSSTTERCDICNSCHPLFQHWGSKHLTQTVLHKIR